MSTPETPLEMIEGANGIFRPALHGWVQTINPTATSINSKIVSMAQTATEVFYLIDELDRFARYVEPHDRVLGPDPNKDKSEAFRAGLRVGALLIAPMFQTRRDVVKQARRYVSQDFALDVKELDDHDKQEAQHMRGAYILNRGGEGLSHFEETADKMEDIFDANETDITNHLYAKAGAGVTMLAIWEGFRVVKEHDIEKEVGKLVVVEDFDSQLADFMNGL